MRNLPILLLLAALLVLYSCKDKKLEPNCGGDQPTYDNGISSILNSKCTNVQCHGTGANQAEYTTYAGLQLAISNGNFKKKVLEDQTMPKNDFLSQEQIDLIQCWSENGYPEK